jgi:transcriptional regulator with XRE-family HTH domain
VLSIAIALALEPKISAMTESKRSKRLQRRHLDHLALILRPIVADKFEGKGARFARAIGVSQSQISQILRGGNADRGVGLPVLIAIQDYLRKEGLSYSIDELLDLNTVSDRTGESREVQRLRAVVEQMTHVLERIAPPPPPPKKPKA